jgi:carboxyl-terminal processing protease
MALAILAGLVAVSVTTVPAAAEVFSPAEPLVHRTKIERVLTEGLALERSHRWTQARTHYAEALRDYPNRRDLEERLEIARLHCDLARRYADHSFAEMVAATTQQQSLDLYGEVLAKIHNHYVKDPDWSRLARRGIYQFDAALSDDTFLARHLPQVSSQGIDAFRQELQQTVHPERIRNRHEVRDVAAHAGRLAAQRLGISPAAVVFEFVCGSAGALDAHSMFLTPSQLGDLHAQIEGSYVGLGFELKADNGVLIVVSTFTGSPAAKAGIRPGDRIVAVAGQGAPVISTDEAAEILKKPAGSTVVTVESPDGTKRDMELTHRRIQVPSIENTYIVDPQHGVAYLKLASFQKTTSRDLETALWRLQGEGMRSLIVDVRGNPGGVFTAAIEVADKFVSQGTLVSAHSRSTGEDCNYQAHRIGAWRMPLVVLIDRDTASASEIFAGAVRDHHRGEVVGERSFGKGTTQGIFELHGTKAGLRLTVANFKSPAGRVITENGVAPTILVRSTAPTPSEGRSAADGHEHRDAVLAAGIEAAVRLSTPRLSQR